MSVSEDVIALISSFIPKESLENFAQTPQIARATLKNYPLQLTEDMCFSLTDQNFEHLSQNPNVDQVELIKCMIRVSLGVRDSDKARTLIKKKLEQIKSESDLKEIFKTAKEYGDLEVSRYILIKGVDVPDYRSELIDVMEDNIINFGILEGGVRAFKELFKAGEKKGIYPDLNQLLRRVSTSSPEILDVLIEKSRESQYQLDPIKALVAFLRISHHYDDRLRMKRARELIQDPQLDINIKNLTHQLFLRDMSENQSRIEIYKLILDRYLSTNQPSKRELNRLVYSPRVPPELIVYLWDQIQERPSIEEQFPVQEAFELGLKHNFEPLIDRFLDHPQVDTSAYDSYVIVYLASRGDLSGIKKVLENPRIRPSTNKNRAIQIALEQGYPEIAKLLINDPRTDLYGVMGYPVIEAASAGGYLEIVKVLIKKRLNSHEALGRAIHAAVKNRHFQLVQFLLSLVPTQFLTSVPEVYQVYGDLGKYLISAAVRNQDLDMINLLLEGTRIKPYSDDLLRGLREAIRLGNNEIVKILLNHPAIDEDAPTVALTEATRRGRLKIIQDLLEEYEYSQEDYDQTLKYAYNTRNPQTVKLLIESTPASFQRESIFEWNTMYGDRELTRTLLRIFDPTQYNQAIVDASWRGNVEVVEAMLEDPRVNPSVRGNAAIIQATKRGHPEVVRLLLSDPQINLSLKTVQKLLRKSPHPQITQIYLNYLSEEEIPEDISSIIYNNAKIGTPTSNRVYNTLISNEKVLKKLLAQAKKSKGTKKTSR